MHVHVDCRLNLEK